MIELVLLGDPVEHSRSPAIQTAALRAAGLEGRYVARRVDVNGMEQAADELRNGRLDGANITMPHKQLAAALSDRLEPVAARAGSVNTWRMESGELVGYSTDGLGIRFAWLRSGLPADAPVLVLGSGGAAAAALLELQAHPLFVSARRPDRAAALLDALDSAATVMPWGDLVPGAVIVNATPLGMTGERLPEGLVEHASGLLDMAYGENATPAAELAARRGIPHAGGLDMLLGQAMASFELWTGVPPDEPAMFAALA